MRTVFHAQNNMSPADRAFRFLIGSACLYIGVIAPYLLEDLFLNIMVGIFGIANLMTSIIGFSPLYYAAKISSRSNHSVNANSLESSTPNTDSANNQDYLSKAGWPTLRGKLLLSVVVPMFIMFVLFARGFYQITHELELKRLSASSVFLSELALKLHNLHGENEKANTDALKLFESSAKSNSTLFVHNVNGMQIQSPFTLSNNDPVLTTKAIEAFRARNLIPGQSEQGMLMQGGVHYVWSAVSADGGEMWATAIEKAPSSHTVVSMLFSPKLLIVFIGFIWFSVWSSIYIVNKFVEKMSEGARNLEHQILHDTLTKLPNLMKFEELLDSRLQIIEKTEQGVAVMLLDLAGFRDVNDTLGYKLGNRLLVQVAQELQELVEPNGDVLRVGGDVFCILCSTSPDRSEVSLLANRVHDSLEIHKELEGVPLAIHGRIGISCYPLDSTETGELMRLADIALVQAKQSHLKTSHYQYENDTHSVRKLTLLARLRGAIENNELSLVYQPKVDIRSKTVVGVEALVRWVDVDYGAVSPIEFVTWAEKSGLIDKLTHWVLRTAEQQNREWIARGIQLPIAVNLSPLNLHDPQLISLIHDLVVKGSFGNGMLELELTENAVMGDPARALKTMTTLNDMGINFAIDDFGTGLSSFTYLRKFPISHLKVDRVFVADPEMVDRDAILLKSMINLGHSLECVVTAEGVEDQKTLDKLITHGCDFIQGYFVCKPKSADDLAVWYSNTEWNDKAKAA